MKILQKLSLDALKTSLIQPYNPEWPKAFQQLKNVLSALLHDFNIDIQHVGSTAVPELAAKPVLDIDIVISQKNQLNDIAARLEKAGYLNRGDQGVPGRFAFRQSSISTPLNDGVAAPVHHLYVCYEDSLALKNHLLFRDALLSSDQLRHEYGQLKLRLSSEPGMTRERYARLKTDFILAVLAKCGLSKSELESILQANT